ncbi:hypothetical protein BOTBODRAFT_122986 [Botryobasidium botryosum FD-172 SS1]|uniref:RING-type domain-containing protein n=1 Tax=Botryobasidium botryosum (strain FD-172 SS1) TaxID=930990 RepID=A0A067N2W6_BOTB1|nr:hypothetical protein BOTBODRAFT_122986 [Botryobasidium botryosum FD-172 SS1]
MNDVETGVLSAYDDVYSYVESVNSNLICCICRTPFVEPTSAKTCSHTFCLRCIYQALEITSQCPVDRSPLTADDLQPAGSIVRNLVDELMVECPCKPSGCTHTCQRQHLASHLKSDCLFVQVSCCEDNCEQLLLKKDIRKHSDGCVHRTVTCEACDDSVKFIDLESHQGECPAKEITCVHCSSTFPRSSLQSHNSTCTLMPIPCPHSTFGCAWVGTRGTLTEAHLATCVYESLKGFITLHSAKIDALESENLALRHRVEELEKTSGSMKRDISIAKASLGPWFRSAGSGLPPAAAPAVPATRQERRRSRVVPLNGVMSNFADDVHPLRNSDEVQGHLDSNLVNPAPAAQFQPPNPMYMDQSSSLGDPAQQPAFFPASTHPYADRYNTSVAPINFNVSLEGSLSSLHSSMIALEGTMNSMERRQDIMLTTETLRMREEVGSLRAIVHGLRMQVHHVMMDRNAQIISTSSVSTGAGNSSGVPRQQQEAVVQGVERSSVMHYHDIQPQRPHPPPLPGRGGGPSFPPSSIFRRSVFLENKL